MKQGFFFSHLQLTSEPLDSAKSHNVGLQIYCLSCFYYEWSTVPSNGRKRYLEEICCRINQQRVIGTFVVFDCESKCWNWFSVTTFFPSSFTLRKEVVQGCFIRNFMGWDKQTSAWQLVAFDSFICVCLRFTIIFTENIRVIVSLNWGKDELSRNCASLGVLPVWASYGKYTEIQVFLPSLVNCNILWCDVKFWRILYCRFK